MPVRRVEQPIPANRLISRIDPKSPEYTVTAGDRVSLSVTAFGRQGISASSLIEDVRLEWNAVDGGRLSVEDQPGNSRAYFTVPETRGTYRVTAKVPSQYCYKDSCTATFTVYVPSTASPRTPVPEPKNPDGTIPAVVFDAQSNRCTVMTPEDGGFIRDGDYSFTVPRGAVRNGEFIGVCPSPTGDASAVRFKDQEYVLIGTLHDTKVVDMYGAAIPNYRLNKAVEICLPLPEEFIRRFGEMQLVRIMDNGTLAAAPGHTRIGPVEMSVCGYSRTLPISIAIGYPGTPGPLPVAAPTPETELPDTGPVSPGNAGQMIWLLLLGMAIFSIAATTFLSARRHK